MKNLLLNSGRGRNDGEIGLGKAGKRGLGRIGFGSQDIEHFGFEYCVGRSAMVVCGSPASVASQFCTFMHD